MRSFPIEAGGPKRVALQRGGAFQQVVFDGQVVLDIPSARSMLDGVTAKLPDGSELCVRSSFSLLRPGLLVARNGVPLPESDFDPRQRAKRASRTLDVLGALFLFMGAAPLLVPSLPHGALARPLGTGATLIVLGFFVARGHRVAMAAALAVVLATTAVDLWPLFSPGATLGSPFALLVRALFLWWMVRGLAAMSSKQP